MKNFLPLFFSLLLANPVSLAQSQLRSAESIIVTNGVITSSGILADSGSEVFIEFIEGDRVAFFDKAEKYTGEILPPTLIEAPIRPPRPRMREIKTIELINDTGEAVSIVSQYSLLPRKERLRLSLKDEALDGRHGAQFLTRIFDEDEIGQPRLWFYDQETEDWERIGGILTESAEPDVKVFSSIIQKTGIYTLWDENPAPTFNPSVDPNEIELAEESPFPSVDVNGTTSGFDRAGFEDNQAGFVEGLVDSVGNFIGSEEEGSFELGQRSETVINNDRENGDFAFDAQLDDALILEDLEETDIVVPAIGGTPPEEADITAEPISQTETPVTPEAIEVEAPPIPAFQSSAPLLQANSLVNGTTLPQTGNPEPLQIPWLIFGLMGFIGVSIYWALSKKA